METNRLKQFCTIVETGNMRKAADLLGISHSGLSKSMKALEAEVGFDLFQPHGRGIVITDAGQRLYERSSSFFTELERLLRHGRERTAGVVRLGSFEVFTSYFIGPLLKEYLPGTEVEIHELVPGRLEEALAADRVDIGITYEPVPRPGIEFMKVSAVEMGAFALQGAFDGIDIRDIPFVAPVSPLEGAPSGVKGRDAWPEDRVKRNIRYRVDLMATGLELVRQGLGAIFIPRFVALLHNRETVPERRLGALALPKAIGTIRRDIYLVKRESTAETDSIRLVAKAIRQICGAIEA